MARADDWFGAHWGAALIAGSFLCAEAGLTEEAQSAIRAELDVLRVKKQEACRAFAHAPRQEDFIVPLKDSLLAAMDGGLREHGHAVIYTSLALRALQELPHLAIPAIVDPICGWNRVIAKVRPHAAPEDTTLYRDERHLVDATLMGLLRFEALVGHPGIHRPNFTHWITHTEALRRFKLEGFGDVWEAGCAGHRAHVATEVPVIRGADSADRTGVSLAAIQAESFWRDASRQEVWHEPWSLRGNPNGDWIAAGHLFKVLYAFFHVTREIQDDVLVQRCARILFERYFDPEVLGG